MAQDALAFPCDVHALPKHPEKTLPKIDLEKKEVAEVHIHKLMLSLRLMDVKHENVVFRIFLLMFKGKVTTWCFALNPRSVHSWNEFEEAFIGKFNDDETQSKLILEL